MPDAGGDDGGDTDDSGDGTGDTGTDDGSTGGDPKLDTDIKAIEDNLFNNLKPEQKNIAIKELKTRWMDLYDQINRFITKIDYIAKTPDNINIVLRVTKLTQQLRDTVEHYIINTFATKSYIENKSELFYSLLILDRLVKLLATTVKEDDTEKTE